MTPEQWDRVEYLIQETECSMAMAVDTVLFVDNTIQGITLDPDDWMSQTYFARFLADLNSW